MVLFKRLNKSRLFSSKDLTKDLGEKSLKGGSVTFIGQVIQVFINFARIIILARLLSPKDFGLINMVLVFIGFAAMFKDAGFSDALLQRKDITHEQVSALFWLNIIICLFLSLGMCICAPIIAWFYKSPQLVNIILVMSFSFLISSFTLQHNALLKRHLYLSAVTVINIVPQLLSLIVTVSLAWWGWGYWALVAGVFCLSFFALPITLYYCPWRPGAFKRKTGVNDMLRFGGFITGFNVINYFSRNADNILIGKFYGSIALGFYSRAYQMFMMPILQIRGPIFSVAVPAMSAIKEDVDRYRDYYFRIVSLMCAIAIPLGMYFMLEGAFIVKIFLGDKWAISGNIFRILATAGMIQPTISSIGLVLITLGRGARYLKIGIFNSVIIVAAFCIGLFWGITGVAVGYVIATWLVALFTIFWGLKSTPIKSGEFISLHIFPMFLSFIVASGAFGIVLFFNGNFLSHILSMLMFACIIIFLLLINSHNRDTVVRVLNSFDFLKKQQGKN
jgi:O-antigen/teichoic acid export membrane protein